MINLYPFLIYVVVTTFTPGPNNIMAMTNAMRDGYKKTIRFVLGIVAGFFVVLFISGLLNMALADLLPSVKKWLNILGAAYMVFLAIHIILSKPAGDDPSANSLNSFKAGFIMQFLNIKVIVYGITVFSIFIIDTYHDPLSIGIFSLGLALVGYAASTTWAFGGNLFREFLLKHYRIFNIAMGGLLIYTAIASLH